jgi:glycosyltransferase involved in cell wall biosynthesis
MPHRTSAHDRKGRRTPRILFLEHAAALGGGELSLVDLAAAYRDESAVALMADGPLRELLESGGVRVHLTPGGGSLDPARRDSRIPDPRAAVALWRATAAIRALARQYDLLYANSPRALLVGAGAALRLGKPLVWHLHDILDRQHFSPANLRLLIGVANARATRIIANSQTTAEAFCAAGGQRSLVRVVHNGFDAAPFDAVTADTKRQVRTELGIPPAAFVVGSFSRLQPWKGHRVLFDALSRSPDVHALVAGGALESGDSAYEEELRARAERSPLSGRVHMVGMRRDLPRLLAACDIVVHTPIWPEPFGRVLVEAMLAGRPIIASGAGGVLEILKDGITGMLVAPGNERAIATSIATLRDDPGARARLARAARIDARARFSREGMLDRIAHVLREIAW